MMPGLFPASRICCWWCQRSVNSRDVSNQFADFSFACPAYAVGRAGIGIPEAVILSKQLGGDLHKGNQDSGVQAAIETDAFLIQAVDVRREFNARADSRGFWQISIAGDRDAAKRSIQKMCGDVLDLPLGRNRLLLPVFGCKGTKQFEQHGIELRKKMGGENRPHGPILHSRLVLSPDAMNARSNYAQTPSSAGWGECWENQKECCGSPCFW